MTPEERQLLDQLFDRLATLEKAPRDPHAVDAINAGLERAPNALYPLVQSVLVQQEALKRSDARIRELEAELGVEPPPQPGQGGFLDNMRDKLLGRREPGSVPSVRPGGSPWNTQAAQPQGQPLAQAQGQPWAGQPAQGGGFGGGGSFLGTAAATVAGVVGGALLMNSMRGMFGNQQQGQSHRAFDQPDGGGAPWQPGDGGDLSRQAGIDSIGRDTRASAYDDGGAQRQGLFDVAENDAGDDGDFGGDSGGFDSGSVDT